MSAFPAKLIVAFALAAAAAFSFAQSDKPVKIGILNDQAGPYSAISGPGAVAAARLAIEDVGPIFGKPVELVVGDHQGKPDVGATLARRWYDQEGVSAIFDIYNSGVMLAVQRIAHEKDKIVEITMASSRDIGGKNCTPGSFQWGTDGYSATKLTIKGATTPDANTWYFLTVDYAAGHSIEKTAREMVEQMGGKVLGSVKFPLNSPDFGSFLLQAQASKAKNVYLIGGGADMINSAKQALEFGLQKGGQKFIPVSVTTEDILALGNKVTAGMPVVTAFYWDESAATRAWAERFRKAFGKMPTDPQANVYSAVFHYLKAVKAAGTVETKAVLAKMKSEPVEDMFTPKAPIRADGRVMRPLWFATVNAPEQMKNPTDLMTLQKRFTAEEAFIPVAESECPLLKR
jgi:branched-chain amino acid transport system substrate-binding protein